tara:strand:- start:10143 stop:11348 length:1206 start_codon:yes stop_codon:yes gene_type:complete
MTKKNLVISRAKNQFLYKKKRKILDFSLSSGAHILGHSNKVFCNSLKNQINKGSNYAITNINELKYKKVLKKTFNEFDEFIFSNSGSEANIRALRITRALSGKNNFAMVNGSWHGSVDNFMFDFKKGKKILPNNIQSLSSGIDYLKKNVVVLPYNNIDLSKNILDKNKKKLSVIIIEPIQCGMPYLESIKYLKFLENYCKKNKIFLWFDEVITGLRVKEFSIYKQFKLKPDIVTFAKCLGGGMPIGITSYNSKIFRKKTLNKKIFLGGTFSGNPISTKVGLDTFLFVKKNKKKIDNHINKLSSLLENEVNNYCKRKKVEFRLQRFESIIRPIFSSKLINNRFYREKYDPNFIKSFAIKDYLLKKDIFISNNCCFFISYCHTKQNLKKLISTLKEYAVKKLT